MTSHVLLRRAGAGLALAAFLTACGGDDSSGPGGFELTATPATLNVVQGTSASTQVSVRRTGTFSGPVTITTEGVPSGLTATVTPSTLEQGLNTLSIITVTAPEGTAVGNATFTIRAHGNGVADQTRTVTVAITPRQTFSVALSPSPLIIEPSTTKTVTATVTRTGGFTGPITVTLEGLPANVTAAPVTIPAGQNSANISVVAASNATAQSVNLLARSQTSGLLDWLTPLQLRVAGFAITSAGGFAITQGTSRNYVAKIGRTDFTGDVTFSVEGLPPEITAPAAQVTGDSAIITFTAAAAAALGNKSLTLRAKAPGYADRTLPLRLTVAPPALGGTLLASGVPLVNLSGAEGTARLFRIYVTPGATKLTVAFSNATSDIDLYLRREAIPTGSGDDCISAGSTGNESCTINNPQPGTWYFILDGYEAYSGVTVTATQTGGSDAADPPGEESAARAAKGIR